MGHNPRMVDPVAWQIRYRIWQHRGNAKSWHSQTVSRQWVMRTVSGSRIFYLFVTTKMLLIIWS